MKKVIKITALCFSLLAMQATQTSSLWESAKNKAKSGYQSAKQGWENLDESTKNAIIGTGIAAAGTAAAAGAAYAGYKAYEGQDNSSFGQGPERKELLNMPSRSNPNKTVRDEYVALLREKDLSGKLTEQLEAEGLIEGETSSPVSAHQGPPTPPRPSLFITSPVPLTPGEMWHSQQPKTDIVPEEGYQ